MREAIFDVLMHHPTHGCDLSGQAQVLDLFAGSGGLGIEALSRSGAGSKAHFVERDRGALRFLRQNIEALGLEGQSKVWPLEARRAVERVDLAPDPGLPARRNPDADALHPDHRTRFRRCAPPA